MPFHIVRQDITKMECDAIVSAANNTLLGHHGVTGMIHRAAGPKLREACIALHGCKTGQAEITPGYDLRAKYVIHTVGPIWQDGAHGEHELLASCYRTSLELAVENGCKSVAFPLISSGIRHYPKEEATHIAVETIRAFLQAHEDMRVWLVVYDEHSYAISKERYDDVQSFIDDHYVAAQPHANRRLRRESRGAPQQEQAESTRAPANEPAALIDWLGNPFPTLDDALNTQGNGFSQTLLHEIRARDMTDAQCYKKANIDRKLFSKIRSNNNYCPSKPTALAFAVALKLSLPETAAFLQTAGYALSRSSKFDIIIEYFIRKREYNIFAINATLFKFDQPQLGQ